MGTLHLSDILPEGPLEPDEYLTAINKGLEEVERRYPGALEYTIEHRVKRDPHFEYITDTTILFCAYREKTEMELNALTN